MIIRTRGSTEVNTLIIEASTKYEDRDLMDFARPGEPLTAEIETSIHYLHNYITIRKEPS